MSLMGFSFHTCTCDTLALAAAKKWQDPDRRGGSGGQASKRAKTDVASESLASPASGSSPAMTGTGWMSLAGVRAPSSALARLQLEGSVVGEDREDDAATEAPGGASTARGALRREEAKKKKQNSHKWGPCMICLKTPSDLEVL